MPISFRTIRPFLTVVAGVLVIGATSVARSQQKPANEKSTEAPPGILADWEELNREKGPVQAVRWTGFLAAPSDGQYTFEVVRQYRGDLPTRLWIDDKLVLDSTPTSIDLEGGDPTRFRSQVVLLSAGKKVPFRLETILNAELLKYVDQPDAKLGAALLWQSRELRRQLVPSQVFSPPAGLGGETTAGLQAEFFENVAMAEALGTRLTSAVDMFWSPSPPLPADVEKYDATLKEARKKVQRAGFVDGLSAQDLRRLANDELWQLASHLRIFERVEFTEWLSGQPQLLGAVDESGISRLLATLYLLPGKEHLSLLTAWCMARPQPRFQLNMESPASAKDFAFYHANFATRAATGQFFQGPYEEDILRIWKENLSRPNGECNLGLAYATIAAIRRTSHEMPWQLAKYEGLYKVYHAQVDAVLARKNLKPDARVTWLVANAAGKESFVRFNPTAAQALEDLKAALATAHSREYKFWALQEVAIRHCAIAADGSVAEEFFKEQESTFNKPQEKAQIAIWRWAAECVKGLRSSAKKEDDSQAAQFFIKSLKQRLEAAKQRGDQPNIERLEGQIAAAEKKRLGPLQANQGDAQSGEAELQRLKDALKKAGGIEGWVNATKPKASPNRSIANTDVDRGPTTSDAGTARKENGTSEADTIQAEKRANSMLKMAEPFVKTNPDAAKRRLRQLIEQYPHTKAAISAEFLLKKLEP